MIDAISPQRCGLPRNTAQHNQSHQPPLMSMSMSMSMPMSILKSGYVPGHPAIP
jgi:hypothetical protein